MNNLFWVSVSALQRDIYFATDFGGIQVYSEETSSVQTLVNSTEYIEAVAWDSKSQQLYFSAYIELHELSQIYRASANGTEVVNVFNSSDCE